jgi:hypothetical protein
MLLFRLRYDNAMKTKRIRAEEVRADSDVFEKFMRRLVQVPHSEIKAALDAEKERKRKPFSAVRVSGVRPKRAN